MLMKGAGAFIPILGGSPAWWTAGGVYDATQCLGAWLAKGADSYAASKLDLTGNGNHLTDGAAFPTWDPLTGWTFAVSPTKYLVTPVIPEDDCAVFVQFANAGTGNRRFFGAATDIGAVFHLGFSSTSGAMVYMVGSESVSIAPRILAGNVGIIGQQPYRNGVPDGSELSAWTAVGTAPAYIGASNTGSPSYGCISDIIAVAYYAPGTVWTPATIAALVAAMDLL